MMKGQMPRLFTDIIIYRYLRYRNVVYMKMVVVEKKILIWKLSGIYTFAEHLLVI
jgi:hypothetical protein